MSRIEDEVCKKIAQRAEVGKDKYGVTMETSPITHLEWLIHAQEEAMDLAVYLQKIIEEETKRLNRCDGTLDCPATGGACNCL
tara:strand:- start:984 stop:1232 length:249 start_codon:yes stop_codon:yes gene_type:complete